MKRTITLLILSYGQLIFAQNNHISFSGVLNKEQKRDKIQLTNLDGYTVSIPVDAQNKFAFASDTLTRGFYELEDIGTIYLSSGCYQLAIEPGENKQYSFNGNGETENNDLHAAKEAVSLFLPVDKQGGFTQEGYYVDPSIIFQKLDSFQQYGNKLFAHSKDSFFQKNASLDLSFYCKDLLYYYYAYYGKDLKKMQELPILFRNKTLSDSTRNIALKNLMKEATIKTMRSEDQEKVIDFIYVGWDKNNEALFRNSIWYRQQFEKLFANAALNKKYRDTSKIFHLPTPADIDIKKLQIARSEIVNPYILSYFEYTLTSSILKKSNDTGLLKKYYEAYIGKATRQHYLEEIKKIYFNKVGYANKKSAPSFAFKNTTDNTVSLESLKGKFIYIDVWATWCVPCKAEIPHLKKLEEIYKEKNIQFVSISVDERQNRNKWLEFVKKNTLGGIQLITDNGFDSPFIDKMSITSIPRFILIDPEGKLVYADALRPSDEKLKDILDGLLK